MGESSGSHIFSNGNGKIQKHDSGLEEDSNILQDLMPLYKTIAGISSP